MLSLILSLIVAFNGPIGRLWQVTGAAAAPSDVARPCQSSKRRLPRQAAMFRTPMDAKKGDPDGATGAMRAAELRFRKRVNKDGIIPENALEEGAEKLKSLPMMRAYLNPFTDDAGIFNWAHLGPNKVGGRIRSILMIDDNTRFVGSVGGGIWKTTDAGANWQPIDDFLPTLSISSLARDAQNGNKLYAGTGEIGFGNVDALPGAGVYRSTDFGASWQQLPQTINWPFARVFAHPFLSNELVAAVSSQASGINGVWKSWNSGDTWTRIKDTSSGCIDVKIDVEAWNDMIACTNDGDVWFSNNGGTTWTRETMDGSQLPSDGGRCEVAFGGSDGTIYISMDRNKGEVWRSTNGASTWQLRSTGYEYLGKQGWYGNAIWACKANWLQPIVPQDEQLVVVGGIDLWRSTDGGTTFTRISSWPDYNSGASAHADQHVIVEHPGFNTFFPPQLANREVWFANDGGIQRTLNIDNVSTTFNWNTMNNNMSITQFYGGAVSPNGQKIIGGAQDNDNIIGGPSNPNGWIVPQTGDGGYCAIDPTNDSIMWGEYVFLAMERSTDSGQSWEARTNGLGDAGDDERALFIAPFVHSPTQSGVLYAGGRSVWKTVNGGANWFESLAPISGVNVSALAMTPADSQVVWAGWTSGSLRKTVNGGTNWSFVQPPNQPGGYFITDIAISPQDPNIVFVTYGGYELDRIWLTTDGGTTWQNRSGSGNPVPAIQINTIAFHPNVPNWVYIGTDLGVLASDDLGVTWNRTPKFGGSINNDGPIHVDVEDLFFDANENLYAATHGRGIWKAWVPYTIYIDKNFGGTQIGTQSNPFNRVDVAVGSTGPAHRYSIKANDYLEGPKVYNKRGVFTATNGTARIR